MAPTLRICMLNAEYPVPAVLERFPTFGAIFHDLLSKASSDTKILSTEYDVIKSQYPDSIDDFDAVVISGAAGSAYDSDPWIRQLDDYIRDVYENHPRVRMFGSCFGHQIICQSLLKPHAIVEADPKGYEIGVKPVVLHDKFREAMSLSSETMRLQFIHHDHVVFETLPENWLTVGSTEHCAVQGVYEPERVFTLQGHFEFDRFVNGETIRYLFSEEWEKTKLEEVLRDIDQDDDAVVAAEIIVRFFLGSMEDREGDRYDIVGGLVTPPVER